MLDEEVNSLLGTREPSARLERAARTGIVPKSVEHLSVLRTLLRARAPAAMSWFPTPTVAPSIRSVTFWYERQQR